MRPWTAKLLLGLMISTVLVACGGDDPAPAVPEEAATVKPPQTLDEFMAAGEGKVVVLLLGMDGCAETRAATAHLAAVVPDFPGGVSSARLDVPPPNGSLLPIENWPHPYFYAVDEDRDIADRLGFFYYPTLYVLDRDGETRFAGNCDPAKLRTMVTEILAEKAGAEKPMYTAPIPAVGSAAPAIRIRNAGGADFDLAKSREKGPVLLLFTSITCPFSREAVKTLEDLAVDLDGQDVSYVAIEKKGQVRPQRAFYDQIDLPGPAYHDADGAICKAYGVDPIPFYFVVNKDGTIAARGPYTKDAAWRALGGALGLAEEDLPEAGAAGAG
jgi:peroxiredoxin